MPLCLTRPLVFFDLETTGTRVETDRIVQIALLKVFPDNTQQSLTYLINPCIPIPQEATAVHGITNETVQNEPTFQQRSEQIIVFLMGCDLAGFNIHKFDLPLLRYEFFRIGIPLRLIIFK